MTKSTFTKIPKTVGVSEFRADMSGYLTKAKKKPLVLTQKRGDDSFVVLSTDAYNKLIEEKEDAEDSAELVRLVEEYKDQEMIPWEKVRKG